MNIRRWDKSQGELNFELLNEQFPKPSFRVSRYVYEPEATFGGRTMFSTWFVLRGRAILANNDEKIWIEAGDVVDLKGAYALAVAAEEPIELVAVFDLRELLK